MIFIGFRLQSLLLQNTTAASSSQLTIGKGPLAGLTACLAGSREDKVYLTAEQMVQLHTQIQQVLFPLFPPYYRAFFIPHPSFIQREFLHSMFVLFVCLFVVVLVQDIAQTQVYCALQVGCQSALPATLQNVFSPQSMLFPIVWCVVYIHFAACSLTTNLQRTIQKPRKFVNSRLEAEEV